MKKKLIPQYIQFVKESLSELSIGNIPHRLMDLVDYNENDCTKMRFIIQPSKGKRDQKSYLMVYSFIQFKIQMLHNFSEYILIMNQHPYFVHHVGIGVVNEMINIAIDLEETISLKHCIESNVINEKQLSCIVLDLIKGLKIIQDNNILYPWSHDESLAVSVENFQGKIDALNPRYFSPNSKLNHQPKTFLKVLYSTLMNEQVDEQANILEIIGTRLPYELQILFHFVCDQTMPDYITYYENQIHSNPNILEFYKCCLERKTYNTELAFDQATFLQKYCTELVSNQQQWKHYGLDQTMKEEILQNERTQLSIKEVKERKYQYIPIQNYYINSKHTDQDVFVKYFRFLNEGELLKAYEVIKTYEEENQVDSITYLALSNTLCKIVENKFLNEYLQNLVEKSLLTEIENEERNSMNGQDEDTIKFSDIFSTQKKQTKRKRSSCHSSEDSNMSIISEEINPQDLLHQLESFTSKKKLILKQYTQKIKDIYQLSINKNPYSVISYFNLSLEYSTSTDIDIIIKLLKKCLVIQSQDIEVLYQLSVLYWNKQNYKEALKYFKKQIVIKQFDIPLCINIYKSYLRLNKMQKAMYYFKKLETKYPQFKKISQPLWLQIKTDIHETEQFTALFLS